MEITENKLDKLKKKLAERYGVDTLINPASKVPQIQQIPTGVFPIDYATKGGIPLGRFTRITGLESSGKSWLTYKIMKSNQHNFFGRKMRTLYVDVERCVDPAWLEKNGVDLELCEVIRPHSSEMTVDVVDALLSEGAYDLFIIDSIAFLATIKQLEASAEKSHMAVHARSTNAGIIKWGLALNKLESVQRDVMPAIVLINQIRATMEMYGNPEFTPGGKAQNYAASLDIRLERKSIMTDEGEMKALYSVDVDKDTGREKRGNAVASQVQFFIPKCKIAQSNVAGQYLMWTTDDEARKKKVGDIDISSYIFDLGVELGVIEQEGRAYSFSKTSLGTKIDDAKATLFSNNELSLAIQKAIMEKQGISYNIGV